MSPRIKRALISVSDKTGVVELAEFLSLNGVEIISTGGTAKAISESGVEVKEVSDHTGFPEIMDGRLKTLHPGVHGGLLAVRGNPEHQEAMRKNGIENIDLLVVNLYPFEETVARGCDFDTCVENIDIGGPAMIRAAAKNHAAVSVVVDAGDYAGLQAEMEANDGATTPDFRRRLAAKAFSRTGAYDGAISSWFNQIIDDPFPEQIAIGARRRQNLRYGENPHQRAAFYVTGDPRPGIATASQLQGKELSFNNLNDTDAAFELVAEFASPACAIIKHANPCGVSIGDDLRQAYLRALLSDQVSAFGGIVALNRSLDAPCAEEIIKLFAEVIIAPSINDDAREIVAAKKNLRVLETGALPDPAVGGMTLRSLAGGYLLQDRDNRLTTDELKVVTRRHPSDAEMLDLEFAFTVCKHAKSNAIIYVKDGATVGIGAGQMSRVDSSRIAAWKAAEASDAAGEKVSRAVGSVVASDAFFPFADGLLAAADAGATAIIQPGGSIRDKEVIAAADDKGIAMVFTGMRHFRH